MPDVDSEDPPPDVDSGVSIQTTFCAFFPNFNGGEELGCSLWSYTRI